MTVNSTVFGNVLRRATALAWSMFTKLYPFAWNRERVFQSYVYKNTLGCKHTQYRGLYLSINTRIILSPGWRILNAGPSGWTLVTKMPWGLHSTVSQLYTQSHTVNCVTIYSPITRKMKWRKIKTDFQMAALHFLFHTLWVCVCVSVALFFGWANKLFGLVVTSSWGVYFYAGIHVYIYQKKCDLLYCDWKYFIFIVFLIK